MAHLPWMEASVEGPIPGCNRLQICGLFAQFCRDLPSYLVDIVDVTMSPVQFETRHPPHTDYVLVPPINEVSSEASRARDGWPFTLWQPGGDAPVISPTFPLAWHPSCPVAASCVRT